VSGGAWRTAGRPGHFGSRRDALHAGYDARYGPGGWRLAWDVAGHPFDRERMTLLYEDAYHEHLRAHGDLLDELCREACDVYDDAPSNMASGLDYTRQETASTHVQDIALRRVVARLGRVFTGPAPVQIRHGAGGHPLSEALDPGRVPFHRPEWLLTPELEGWWLPGSVESFYQSNKLLQVRVAPGDAPGP
jgi:hypothetical protein